MMDHQSIPILVSLGGFDGQGLWSDYGGWLLAAAICILGLLIYGWRDTARLSLRRIWAIGGVCFRDAIRRRVLWITPLAMLGIVVVSQLQRPIDEADAVRLTVKFCFFAIALVVTTIAVITAATNLPRDIDSRVIFTIVTKPVSRLEIVLGKIVGLSRVCLAVLLIMGIFSLAYLHLRAYVLSRGMAATDAALPADMEVGRSSGHGLLFAQSVTQPVSVTQYARLPDGDGNSAFLGGSQEALVPFEVPADTLVLGLAVRIGVEPITPGTPQAPTGEPPPTLSVQIVDAQSGSVVISSEALQRESANDKPTAPLAITDTTGRTPIIIDLPPARREQLTNLRTFYVQVIGLSDKHFYLIGPDAVHLKLGNEQAKVIDLPPVKPPIIRGSESGYGQELKGSADERTRGVAVLAFDPADKSVLARKSVSFEFNTTVKRTGAESEDQVATLLRLQVVDRKTGKITEIPLQPESRRPLFFSVPSGAFSGEGFDILLRNSTPGHIVGINPSTLTLVSHQEYFGLNLAKGLFVLWLFSILVIAIAFCCSTRLSWPITVVLTVVVILCRWAVSNLDVEAGLGQQVTNEFFSKDPGSAQAVSSAVNGLTHTLRIVAGVLPDISPFAIIGQIEDGLSISLAQLGGPLSVLLLFGLPLVTFSYIFLRNKEVAP